MQSSSKLYRTAALWFGFLNDWSSWQEDMASQNNKFLSRYWFLLASWMDILVGWLHLNYLVSHYTQALLDKFIHWQSQPLEKAHTVGRMNSYWSVPRITSQATLIDSKSQAPNKSSHAQTKTQTKFQAQPYYSNWAFPYYATRPATVGVPPQPPHPQENLQPSSRGQNSAQDSGYPLTPKDLQFLSQQGYHPALFAWSSLLSWSS